MENGEADRHRVRKEGSIDKPQLLAQFVDAGTRRKKGEQEREAALPVDTLRQKNCRAKGRSREVRICIAGVQERGERPFMKYCRW